MTAPGTGLDDMALALAEFGHILDEYDTTRAGALALCCTGDEMLATARRKYQAEAYAHATAPPATVAAAHERDRREYAEHAEVLAVPRPREATAAAAIERRQNLSVGEFIEAAGPGTWLLAAGASPVVAQLTWHWLAVRDGRVIAGDSPDLNLYRDAACRGAYRVTTRNGD